MDLGLKDAAVVVSGGSKGMGRAAAESFAAEGARVAVLARGQAALDQTVAHLAELGSPDAVGLSVDLHDSAAVEAAFDELGARWGQLNALVNAAGPGSAGPFEALDDQAWLETFEMGTMSAVRTVRAAVPWLKKAAWARIVNLAAYSVRRQSPGLVAYTAAKAALTSVSKNLARSLAADGISVNTVSPGMFMSDSLTAYLESVAQAKGIDPHDPGDAHRVMVEEYGGAVDMGRAGLPSEIGPVIVFLASKANSYMTGANVNVDGGTDF